MAPAFSNSFKTARVNSESQSSVDSSTIQSQSSSQDCMQRTIRLSGLCPEDKAFIASLQARIEELESKIAAINTTSSSSQSAMVDCSSSSIPILTHAKSDIQLAKANKPSVGFVSTSKTAELNGTSTTNFDHHLPSPFSNGPAYLPDSCLLKPNQKSFNTLYPNHHPTRSSQMPIPYSPYPLPCPVQPANSFSYQPTFQPIFGYASDPYRPPPENKCSSCGAFCLRLRNCGLPRDIYCDNCIRNCNYTH